MDKIKRKIAGQIAPAILGCLLFIWVGSSVTAGLPVLWRVSATEVQRTATTVQLEVQAQKLRHGCLPIKKSTIFWYLHDNVWSETLRKPSFPQNRDPPKKAKNTFKSLLSRQNLGVFLISGIEANTTSVRVTVNHQCDNEIKLSVLGPWRITQHD